MTCSCLFLYYIVACRTYLNYKVMKIYFIVAVQYTISSFIFSFIFYLHRYPHCHDDYLEYIVAVCRVQMLHILSLQQYIVRYTCLLREIPQSDNWGHFTLCQHSGRCVMPVVRNSENFHLFL